MYAHVRMRNFIASSLFDFGINDAHFRILIYFTFSGVFFFLGLCLLFLLALPTVSHKGSGGRMRVTSREGGNDERRVRKSNSKKTVSAVFPPKRQEWMGVLGSVQ